MRSKERDVFLRTLRMRISEQRSIGLKCLIQRLKVFFYALAALLVLPALLAAEELKEPDRTSERTSDHGVILLYHHVSENTPALTSVTPEQFDAHLAYIEAHGFQVVPLNELLNDIYNGKGVPENALAITFDDAYQSVYENAFPRLYARGLTFTVFVSDESIDRGYAPFMTWPQMREMSAAGVDFGAHSLAHKHLVRLQDELGKEAWAAWVTEDIKRNKTRLEAELNIEVRTFAYPYGEYNPELTAIIEEMGLYGLGQQSGAVGSGLPKSTIPRFPMMHSMAGLDRLGLALNSRPLPINENNPGAIVRDFNGMSGEWRFSLAPGKYDSANLACFSAQGEVLRVQVDDFNVTVTLPAFSPGRNKVNCTVPSTDQRGEYFWLSQQWLVRAEDGSWPVEP